MTGYIEKPLEWCGDCVYFDLVICDNIGVCVEIKSDHNRHILDISHPACPFWRPKK